MESGSERSTAMLSFAVDITLGCSPGSLFSKTEPLTLPSMPTILFAASRLYTEKRSKIILQVYKLRKKNTTATNGGMRALSERLEVSYEFIHS